MGAIWEIIAVIVAFARALKRYDSEIVVFMDKDSLKHATVMHILTYFVYCRKEMMVRCD